MNLISRAVLALSLLSLAACGGSDNNTGSPGDTDPPPLPTDFAPFAGYGTFLSVLPPGQADSNTGGQTPEAHFDDQLTMYEALSFTQPGQLTAVEDLTPTYFKDAAFRAEDSFDSTVTVSDAEHEARIGTDEFGVPHIYGDTRADVYFGTGYASGRDRLFVMDILRHVGRGRLSDFAGAAAGNYGQDRDVGAVAGYDEAEIQAQIEQLTRRFGATGEQIIADSTAFVAGINAYIADLGTPGGEPIPAEYPAILKPDGPTPFTTRDVLAVATLVQATFAVGGGSEHRQVQLLNALNAEFGSEQACALWRDLRHFDDPEKIFTTSVEFATQSPPGVDETACPFDAGFAAAFPGAVMFDPGSLQSHQLLEIVDCFAPNVDCPDYTGTVVDNDPEPAGSKRAAATSAASAGDDAAEAARLAVARKRVQRLVRGVQLALSSDSLPTAMSNAILVNADQTADGRPIAVFGPQTGYFVPQLLLEFAQHGGDVNVRGMSFAGLPYVVIGRGVDHAWSATSAGADIIDIRVLRLCDADGDTLSTDLFSAEEDGYLYNGVCTPIFERVDTWTAVYHGAAAPPMNGGSTVGQAVTRTVLRAPDYGPIFARATVAGQPVALARQRTTFFGEVDSAVPFVPISRNEMTDPQSFFEVFNSLTGTFNWFYVDAENIAYFNSGLLPRRADGIHPDLPQWGTGEFDWDQTATGRINLDFDFANFLPLEAHPREANPERGYFANWNNPQAPGFWANDGQTSYGPVDRAQMLGRKLAEFQRVHGASHTPATMVEIMADAAHTDLRGQEMVPQAAALLGEVTAAESAQADAINATMTLLSDWATDGTLGLGAQRRDRDGPARDTAGLVYEDRAAAVFMDTWFDTFIDNALTQITAVEDSMVGGRHDLPNDIGSAFNGGWYGYARRVLDMELGISEHPYTALACDGAAAVPDCRAALIASFEDAFAALGSTDPADWDGTDNANGSNPAETREQDDAISSSGVGAAPVPDIHWQNRPTYQQVVQPSRRRVAAEGDGSR